MKSALVAYDKNFGIGGADNDLLWHRDMPADLRRFKELTTGNVVVMGRKTYESIGRPLPNRQNIVISRTMETTEGVTVVRSLDEAYESAEPGKEIFIIGGNQIYTLAFDTLDRIYATEVDGEFDATTFFPAFDKTKWKEVSREHHEADERNKYSCDYVIYDRI